MQFPAGVNTGNAQTGPNYGCLGSQPNPAWFFMQIANGGPISIVMSAANDIDFICWGPFASVSAGCGNLTTVTEQDCSYSSSATETCTIANAIPGQFYLLLITNFSNLNQLITFNQNNSTAPGAGSTNCGVICSITATNSGMICAGQSATLSAITGTAITSYTWTGPGGFTSNSQNPVVSNVQSTGAYTIVGTNSSQTCSAVTSITVTQPPAYSIVPQTATVCQGGSVTPSVSFNNPVNPNQYSYLWSQGPGIAAPTSSSTAITAQPITGSASVVVYSVVVSPTNISCPLQQTFTLTVNNPATPSLTIPGPLCSTSGTVQLTGNPSGGTWTNNSGVSPSGILNPSTAPVGTSSVMYAVAIGTCIATSSANINVSQFNPASFTGSIAPLCVTSPAQNLMNIVQTTLTGIWSGTGVSGTYSFIPAGLATNTYALIYNTVSTPDPTVCPASNTLIVSVLNPPQPIITAVGPYCNTASTVQMVVSPNTGTWTPVSYQTSSGIFDPSLAAIGINTVQYVAGTFTCNAQQTSTINIEAFVPAVITGSVSDKCNTGTQVNLGPLTSATSGTWSGPGVMGSVFDPSASGTGVLTLTWNTNSSPIGLCPDSDLLSVNVYSLANPVLTQVGPFCNMSVNLQVPVSPIGGTYFGINTNAINQQGIFAPTQANIGDNIISYSITSGPCVAYAQSTISVEAFVSADLSSYAGPFCKNDPAINLNSIVQNQGGVWSGPALVGSIFTPANANIGNNNVLIYYTQSSPTASLCPDSSAIRIQVNDIPVVSIMSNIESGCLPVEVIFNTPNVNSGTGEWNFGDGSANQPGLSVTHLYTLPGSHTVTFTYDDEIGCRTQTMLPSPINAYPVPQANFSFNPDEITLAAPDVQFTNLSTVLGNNTYQWQIGGLYQLSDVNPQVTFPSAGDYNITLTAVTANGCKDVISRMVSVKNNFGVYVPTSFTPNFDGVNDIFIPVFSPYGLDLKIYDMEIFDRWGHSLFHTKDYTVGWDGMAKGSDEAIKQEVYVYKIKYKDAEGKIYNKTGHITLIK